MTPSSGFAEHDSPAPGTVEFEITVRKGAAGASTGSSRSATKRHAGAPRRLQSYDAARVLAAAHGQPEEARRFGKLADRLRPLIALGGAVRRNGCAR
jgi:hypothetical protein